jgi:hypothetical protein
VVSLTAAVAAGFLSSSASAQPKEYPWDKLEKALAAEMKTAAADCNEQRYYSARQSFIESKMSHGYTESEADRTVRDVFPFRRDCPPASALYFPSPVNIVPRAQPIVGLNLAGGFQGTNFPTDPQFNVNGSGVIGGAFGGVLFPVPNTNALAGFRVGGEGGYITGNIVTPPASPLFTYNVRTNWIVYQDALLQVDMLNGFFNGIKPFGSVGAAESDVSAKGTSGTFSVTDSGVRTGMTFTAGVTLPVFALTNGVVVDLFAQYRGTQWIGVVNIPGAVPISSFTNEVDLGVTFNFNAFAPPVPR